MKSFEIIRQASAIALVSVCAGCATWSEMDRSEKGTAVGATGQLEYQLLLSVDLGYLDDATYDELSTELLDLRRQLTTHFMKVKALR